MKQKNLAHQIDSYFRKHGSPVAGLGHLFVAFGRKYGVDPRLVAATAMKETEGGLTGTGRRGQYNLTGLGGVGNMASYQNYKQSIRASTKNFATPRYKGKSLAQQTAMWVSGGPPTASTAGYTNFIKSQLSALGGYSPNFKAGQPGGAGTPRSPGSPATPGRPAVPAVPGVPGVTLPNPTGLFQSLGDLIGVPWTLELPDRTLPKIPGIPGQKATKGKPGKPGTPAGTPATNIKFSGKYVLPVPRPIGGSDFSYVDAEGAPDRNGTRHHAAHDWFGVDGGHTPVYSPSAGKIVEVKQATTWSGQVMGGTVKVQAPNGMVFVFRHVQPGRFKVGQRVKAGAQIARIGPWTDGPDHTHVEIWKTLAGGYRYENMVDPVAFFSRKTRNKRK